MTSASLKISCCVAKDSIQNTFWSTTIQLMYCRLRFREQDHFMRCVNVLELGTMKTSRPHHNLFARRVLMTNDINVWPRLILAKFPYLEQVENVFHLMFVRSNGSHVSFSCCGCCAGKGACTAGFGRPAKSRNRFDCMIKVASFVH